MSDNFTFRENELQISILIDTNDSYSVMEEVRTIVTIMVPDFDFTMLNLVYNDVLRLFRGRFPGYRKCNTRYHDLSHTSDALLAMIRLIHGAALNGQSLGTQNILLGLICALMHDTGYIQKTEDRTGTGAKYTAVHIQRSIDFMENYFVQNGYSDMPLKDYSDILNCTGLKTHIHELQFESGEIELLGKMMGTADLVGQLADRTYLEKLPYLYHEFMEAGIPGFKNELDFFKKTLDFFEITKIRLQEDLGGVTKFFSAHFKARFSVDRDLYDEAIQNNLGYLRHVLKHHKKDYRKFLRRTQSELSFL